MELSIGRYTGIAPEPKIRGPAIGRLQDRAAAIAEMSLFGCAIYI